ncbi:FG-GAP repeat domain-containing protein [Sorangium sp. So ce1097]|uniref:FG-GAP repeat domain-containing protein n=1 Tax=Sorangium sp. So ce1097 TaxID=3133330 RepID=UPI003F5E46B7
MGVLLLSCPSCTSDHQVSPWGAARTPPLGAYVAPPDLDAHLRAIDVEAAELELELEVELRGALPRGGGEVVLRGYAGTDALGRRTSAVRAATPRGVVMAAGPLDSGRVERTQATRLVPSLVPGAAPDAAELKLGVFRSGTDINRDGAPDVVLSNEAGDLEIWAVQPFGAARYTVELAVPPRFALDIDQDGILELAGRVPVKTGDPIAPELVDVAGFDGGRYTHRGSAARAFHAARAGVDDAARAGADNRDHDAARAGADNRGRDAARAGTDDRGRDGERQEPPKDDAARLRRALERAWHALLAGRPAKETLAALDREPVPPDLQRAFAAHRARVASAAAPDPASAPAREGPRRPGDKPTRPQGASETPDRR